jgi:hypothetical protein
MSERWNPAKPVGKGSNPFEKAGCLAAEMLWQQLEGRGLRQQERSWLKTLSAENIQNMHWDIPWQKRTTILYRIGPEGRFYFNRSCKINSAKRRIMAFTGKARPWKYPTPEGYARWPIQRRRRKLTVLYRSSGMLRRAPEDVITEKLSEIRQGLIWGISAKTVKGITERDTVREDSKNSKHIWQRHRTAQASTLAGKMN